MTDINTPEELARLQQENLASAMRFAQLTVEASQKLLGVQLDAARQAVEAGSRNVHALSHIKTPEDAVALRAALAEQAVQQALEYSESVYSVAAELKDQYGKLVGQRIESAAADMQGAMEKMLDSAPPGAAAAAQAVRDALIAGRSAIEGIGHSTRQMSDAARANVKAASDATLSAVKSNGSKPKT